MGARMELSLRGRAAFIDARLRTIHPNPGPETRRGRRSVGEVRREKRRTLRHRGRRERRRRRLGGGVFGEGEGGGRRRKRVVTWNVQGLSMREANRERLRRVVRRVELQG